MNGEKNICNALKIRLRIANCNSYSTIMYTGKTSKS